jgi:AbrB family looped-hinge helix DNA binding protein
MTVTEKGQVTIPKPIRDALGIHPGSEVEFVPEGDHAVLRKIERIDAVAERLRKYRAAATAGLSTDQILGMTRV